MPSHRRSIVSFVLLLALNAFSFAAGAGDTSVNALAGLSGRFYIFADKTIQIASSIEIIHKLGNVKNITTDQDGNALVNPQTNASRTWSSGAYLPVAGRANTTGFVYVNEGDNYASTNGSSYAYVMVIDHGAAKIVARPRLGSRLSKIYAFKQTGTVWSHSDAEGAFYIMSMANGTYNISITTVTARESQSRYGELAYDDSSFPYAYGTNDAEQNIFKYQIDKAALLKIFPYSASLRNRSSCLGLRSAFYAKANKHVFLECTDKAGVLEWDAQSDKFVTLHEGVVGTVSGPPTGDRVLVTNYDNSSAAIFATGANGFASTLAPVPTIQVPSQPGNAVYHYNTTAGDKPVNYSGYNVFWSTARNTNLNNMAAAGEAVTSPTYASKPSDCQYSAEPTSRGGLSLATGANGVLTPQCGACASGITNNSVSTLFNASMAGFEEYSFGNISSLKFVSAGAILPRASQASNANACSFAISRRQTILGGALVATVADLPKPSVFFYDGDRNGGPYNVSTAPSPVQLVFVPVKVDNVSEIFASLGRH